MANNEFFSDWRMVPGEFGPSFVREAHYPGVGLTGTETKNIYRPDHSAITENLVAPRFRIDRELRTEFNRDGSPSGYKAIRIEHAGLNSTSFSMTLPIDNEDVVLSFGVQLDKEALGVHYFESSGKLGSFEYEYLAGTTTPEGFLDFAQNPEQSVKDLSSVYADKEDGIFYIAESLFFTDRQLKHHQRSWTDDQRQMFNTALEDVLDLEKFEKKYQLDESLTDEQKKGLMERLKNGVSGNFPTQIWTEVRDYIDLTHHIEAAVISLVADALEIQELDLKANAPGVRFDEVAEDTIAARIFDRSNDDTLHEGRLPFSHDLRYDQFVYNVSRTGDGRLLLATTNLGRESGSTWFYVKEAVNVDDLSKFALERDPREWLKILKSAPFVDPSLSLVPKGENPHAYLINLAMTQSNQAEGRLAFRHMGNCPDCTDRMDFAKRFLTTIFEADKDDQEQV